MNVVSAGVHHVHFHAEIVGGANGAGVGNAREFLQGQGIEIGADENRRARAVLQDADHPVATDAGRYFDAQRLEFLSEARRSVLLAEREFGMGVAMGVELFERRVFAFHQRRDGLGEACSLSDQQGHAHGEDRRRERVSESDAV